MYIIYLRNIYYSWHFVTNQTWTSVIGVGWGGGACRPLPLCTKGARQIEKWGATDRAAVLDALGMRTGWTHLNVHFIFLSALTSSPSLSPFVSVSPGFRSYISVMLSPEDHIKALSQRLRQILPEPYATAPCVCVCVCAPVKRNWAKYWSADKRLCLYWVKDGPYIKTARDFKKQLFKVR